MKRTYYTPNSIMKQTREYVFFVTLDAPTPRSDEPAPKAGLTLVVNR